MTTVDFLPIFVVCSLLIFLNIVEGNGWMLTKEEDFELEQQLELLNKPAVKNIHAPNGYIYDCVDFYEQPAFDHPALKDHKFDHELVHPNPIDYKNNQIFSNQITDKEGEECPVGTVRIKRITKDDLLTEKLVGEEWRTRYAVVRTKAGPKRYGGAGGSLTVYKPNVTLKQSSAARLLLKNGGDSIEVGWRVEPRIFHEHQCHFYIRSIINKKVCYGVRCPGFVITNPKADVEADLAQVISTRGGNVFVYRFDISRDIHGNWMVTGGVNETKIGYWPKSIFTENGLTQLASHVEWGGEVSSPKGTPEPPMGSGFFPVGNATLDCLYYNMTLVTETGQVVDADNVAPFADSAGYKVIDMGNLDPSIGHAIVFGGPAGGM